MLCEWRVRKQGSQSNPYHDYRKFPTVFCLKINHGGEFTTPPKIRYRGGKVNWIDTIDADVFSINEINHMMKDIGYENPSFEYFYKEPNTDLENGLKKLDCDQDVLQLMKFVAKYKVIELYVVHGVNEEPMNVVPLNVDDSLINKDMDNFVLDDNGDDVVDDVSEDEWLRSCLNLVPREKKAVVESEVVGQSNRDKRDESTRSEVEREHGSSSEHDSSSEDDSDSQDSDFDEQDNIIDDVEVDMAEFKRNIDENVEWVGSKDKVEQVEEVFEDEEVDYEDMDTGSESENEGARRKALNMHIRKQKADAKLGGNVWKENFFIGQEFESNTLIKEMLTRVSVEQRRQLYLKKNDKNRLRAHCRGKVPQFTFEDGIESRGSKGKLVEGSKCKVAKGSKGRVAEGSKVKGAEGSNVEGAEGSKKKGAEGSKQKGVKGKGQVGGSTGNFKDGGCSIEDKEESCPWFLQCSKLPNKETWAVKTFHDTHTCLQSRKVKRCTATFLSKTVEAMYMFKINPPNGPELWEKSNNLNTIIPPAPKPQIGRPPKKRRKSAAELSEGIVQGKKLSRAGKSITCSNCKGVGHNKKSCPNVTSASNAQGPNVGATHTTHAYRDTQAASEIHICSQAPPATQVTKSLPSKRQKRPVKKMNL
ncbi:transposase, mutator type [Artemisia annua]|uniref:Transposase, mutator type n=1 Tax=Artemisia annua TaxID=35608 RepID=A0A2U1NQ92_ARTAN|nr:transposase, mutator type [Artemisia annua]